MTSTIKTIALGALALAVSGCGSTDERRAASGGLAGAGVGALAGGPIGALVGGAVGAAGGAALDRGVVDRAMDFVQEDEPLEQRFSGGSGESIAASNDTREEQSFAAAPPQRSAEVRKVQQRLQQLGLYDGRIDGILGPKTEAALLAYAQRRGAGSEATMAGGQQGGGSASSASAGSGSTGRTGSMSQREEKARTALHREGFVGLSEVRPAGNGTFAAVGLRDSRTYRIIIEPDSGQIVSAEQVRGAPGQALSSGPAMTEQQIRIDLRNEGYEQLAGLRREGDVYWLQGQKDGATYNIEVDAETGRIIRVNRAGSAGSAGRG